MSRRDPQGFGWEPSTLRVLIDCHRRYINLLNDMRKEDGLTLDELLGISMLLDEHHDKLTSLQRRLDRVETHRFTLAKREAMYQAGLDASAVAA